MGKYTNLEKGNPTTDVQLPDPSEQYWHSREKEKMVELWQVPNLMPAIKFHDPDEQYWIALANKS